MIRSLQTGVSGLKSNQVKLDVVGNNISNANTVGYKRSRASFNEVLGQQLLGVGRTAGGTGINPAFVGLGVSVGSIDKNWTQGPLETTNNATDLALSGDGFFIAKAGDRTLLTRAGNFTFNRNGELVTANGLNVQGWAYNNGELVTGATRNIEIDLNATAPATKTTTAEVGGNLAAETPLTDPNATTAITVAGTLNKVATTGDIAKVSTTIYDANGVPRTVELTLTRAANAGTNSQWTASVTNPSAGWTINTPTVTFDLTSGALTSTTPLTISDGGTPATTYGLDLSGLSEAVGSTSISASQDGNAASLPVDISTVIYDSQGKSYNLVLTFEKTADNAWDVRVKSPANLTTGGSSITFNADGSIASGSSLTITDASTTDPFNINLDLSNLTQYSGSTTATFRDQNGAASGTLIGYSINPEGIVELNFTNGQQQKVFRLAIGNVNNANGLEQQGENFYMTTSASGELQLVQAGRELRTAVVAGTLEMSNVDLASEFTEMIVAQRGYQASARVITTSDELLQETVQLKR